MPQKSLKDEEVLEVVSLFKAGFGCRRISQKLDIKENTCRAILRGRNYRNLTGGRLMNGKRQKTKRTVQMQPLPRAGT